MIAMNKVVVVGVLCLSAFTAWACSKGDGKNEVPQDPILTYFPNEVKAPLGSTCFAGAYYRKCVSSFDLWLGITGKVVLPKITFDPNRTNPSKPSQFLDNPSVYVGGNASGQETDIGLTWEVIRDDKGNVTQDRRAFRPFLRRTGYVPTGQTAFYENAPAQPEYYWYQGDTVTITLKLVASGVLHLAIEGKGKKYERDFQCDGYQQGVAMQFKRVNAIDQVANEGKPAQPTIAKVDGSRWFFTRLLRSYQGQVVEAPMHTGRFTDMRCPNLKFFSIRTNDDEKRIGAEEITIDGSK